jgi:hypothetical protein
MLPDTKAFKSRQQIAACSYLCKILDDIPIDNAKAMSHNGDY